jgi:serine/threonine protein phosphatase PrpC
MLTEDHRPTIKRERDRIIGMGIKLETGQTRLNGLAVSRALGDHFPKEAKCGLIAEPYVNETIKIEPTDSHIIIASDGVTLLSQSHAYTHTLTNNCRLRSHCEYGMSPFF